MFKIYFWFVLCLWGASELNPVMATVLTPALAPALDMPPLENPDKALLLCLQTYPGTSSEAQCYRSQTLVLEKEVERLYQALGGDRNVALKHSHLLWQNYLSSERLYLEKAFFVAGSQSEWLKARATYLLFKSRAVALQHYLDYLNAHQ